MLTRVRRVCEEVAHRREYAPWHVTGDLGAAAQPSRPAGEARSDYERYLNTEELLGLQKGPGEWVHRDELLFQVVHQSSELWLKLAWNDTAAAAVLVGEDDLGAALRLLRRASMCLRFITGQLDMLEQMSPWEYQEIRKVLGHGSGFDSPGVKELRPAMARLGEAFHAAHASAQASRSSTSTSTGGSTSSCTSWPRR